MQKLIRVSLIAFIIASISASVPINITAKAQDDETVKPIVTLGKYGGLTDVAWSPDGTILAASTYTGIVLYDKALNEIGYLRPTSDLHFAGKLSWSPSGTYLTATNGSISFGQNFSRRGDGILWSDAMCIWEIASQAIEHCLDLEENTHVYTQVWNNDETQIAVLLGVAEEAPMLMIWDVETNIIRAVDVGELEFSDDTDLIWTDDNQGIEATVAEEKYTIALAEPIAITQTSIDIPPDSFTSISPDGQHQAVVAEGVVTVTGAEDNSFVIQDDDDNLFSRFTKVSWSADSQRIVVWGYRVVPTLVVVDVQTGEILLEFRHDQVSTVASAKLNADGSALAIRGARFELLVYDFVTDTWEERWLLGYASRLAFSPDGTKIATVNGLSHQIYIWNAMSGEPLEVWQAPDVPYRDTNYLETLAWSPDGKYIATGSFLPEGEGGFCKECPIDLFIWSAEIGQVVQVVPALAYSYARVVDIQWSADSQIIAYWTAYATGVPHHIGAYNIQTQEMIFQYLAKWMILDIALHPTGEVLAVSHVDFDLEQPYSTIVFIDVATGNIIENKELTPNYYNSVVWHPTGEYLTTHVNQDQNIQIWQWDDNEVLSLHMEFSLPNYYFHNNVVKWNAQGTRLMTVYVLEDTVAPTAVQVWDVDLANQTANRMALFTSNDPDYFLPWFNVRAFDWSADGHYIVANVSSVTTSIWEVPAE